MRLRPSNVLQAAALLVTAGCAGTLFAQGGEWYEGRTSGFWGLSPQSQVFESTIGRFGMSTFGGQVDEPVIEKNYGGYRITDLFAVEGARSTLSLPAGSCGYDSLSTDLDQHCRGAAWSLTGVATLPFQEGLSLYGRLGLQYWENNNRVDNSLLRFGHQQDVGTMYGVGVSYEFRKDWYLHLDMERYSDLSQGLGLRPGGDVGLRTSINTFGLSVRF
jgi:hypothetical protein